MNLATGGMTGIALAAHHFLAISISLSTLLLNMGMLLAGLSFLGRKFAITTLGSTFLYPLFLELCDRAGSALVVSDDILRCTVFSGLGIRFALDLIIRTGASTGKMDIPPLVLKKFFRVSASASLAAIDFAVLFCKVYFALPRTFFMASCQS